MTIRHHPPPSTPPHISPEHRPPDQATTYNIIPINLSSSDDPSLGYPEVRAAIKDLRDVGDLYKPPFFPWERHHDILDWLGAFFGFQNDNVSNQREHLVLHLANSQMRLLPPPDDVDTLHPSVVHRFRRKLLSNYTRWCSFLGRTSNIWIPDNNQTTTATDDRNGLLYIALYLLIWGESANLRFMPECICYVFHHMAMEMNRIILFDEDMGRPDLPFTSGENGFLNRVVTPIYKMVKAEVEKSNNGTAPHSNWRNYDDINEYFWSSRCFDKLKWPIDVESNFFGKTRVGKTGFVEQRSFFNLFRSFDRLWTTLILFLQVAVIIAWKERYDYPWQALRDKNIQVELLSVFITWSALQSVKSILDAVMQYKLVSRETLWLGVRMVLKVATSAFWIYIFVVFYVNIWNQRSDDQQWSVAANQKVVTFLKVALLFMISDILALVFSLLPWIGNFVESTDRRISYMLTWWFESPSFVGRGLREGLVDTIKYSIFWIVVLASKFSFSYFMQIQPMIRPTKDLLDLQDVTYEWHEFFGNSNQFAVALVWAPVILVYLMDLQIWYSIYSSIVGWVVGMFSHLGEIRDMQQLRLWFQYFASAMKFNLMPGEEPLNQRRTFKSKFKDAVRRLKLRYGFGRPVKKIELNQVEACKFTLVWNEIILTFREEDILSDHEVELLELPLNTWNIRVVRWPCLLLCYELRIALIQTTYLVDAPDSMVWEKISRKDYRRCAVIEAYDSVRHLLLTIVKYNTPEHSIVKSFFQEIDNAVNVEKFTKTFNMYALKKIHAELIELVDLIIKPKKDLNKVVNSLQALYEVVLCDFFRDKRTMDELKEDGLAPHWLYDRGQLLFEDAVELPNLQKDNFYRQARRLHTVLTSRDLMNNVPENLEARRRIAFFSNSLFMNMPHAPQVEKMVAFSVLTPYYNEEVMYNKEQLKTENEDGVSTLYYLQTIYADEWKNFLERMRRQGMKTDEELWTVKLQDLRLWASYRGQTLARTVRGMMYYNRALKLLAYIDSASERDLLDLDGSFELMSMKHSGSRTVVAAQDQISRADSTVSTLLKDHVHVTASMKYTYVVACQIYGTQKAEKNPHADEILYLMKNNEALRVAFVDEVQVPDGTIEYYSVLVKYAQDLEKEVEIYRVKLPGPFKLGEGKPENQNHAMIFTRGDAVQTIDMNQDNYFEEALKMRNLLEEFRHYYGIRKPTILGVREFIFTGSVSTLASFMSVQETNFVTLSQRVLANPLKIRLHYGHPDVFDRFWFLTRGGISKGSRLINLNEDIFAGFNCTLRGGNVTHHEYIQVGKGRDVGLNQITMFEAKVASGNGEQVLSRDVYRLGNRLDFFRMLSFYFTTVGFFFNTLIILLTVYAFMWGRLYLALSGVESSAAYNANANRALGTILSEQFMIQLGLFSALPILVVEKSLEISKFLQLDSIFFTFSLGTRAHYFGRTILHGGAKYRATGRGFVLQHKTFADNYRLYARSHFVKAIELGLILTLYAGYSTIAKETFTYKVLTISSWFLVFSWIMAPFLFNPSGFDWLKTLYDFEDLINWIWFQGGVLAKSEESWEKWWYEEQDHLRTTRLSGKLFEIILDLRFFFFQYGIVYQLGIAASSKSIAVYLLSWIYVMVALGLYFIIAYTRDNYAAEKHVYYRLVQFLVIILVSLIIIGLIQFTHFKFFDLLLSLLAFIPTGWGFLLIAQVLRPILHNTRIWGTVVSVARMYDIMFGLIIMTPVVFLSWMPGFQTIQTRMLFNDAFSRGLQIFMIIGGEKSKRRVVISDPTPG